MSRQDPATLVQQIDEYGSGLTDWEVNFVADLLDDPPRQYSERQIEVIERIYDEKC